MWVRIPPRALLTARPDLASPGEQVTIPDGATIRIRPIVPADKGAIVTGFERIDTPCGTGAGCRANCRLLTFV